uniref:NADH-ubiquinone oxidoreductase chain 5 n=1 Tax=Cerion tridentatum costellata TaxID=1108932 RepID=A0A1W6Q5F2_9EUPU|nr:NADH dehydrogenase subunit 5 [Cerion tridentatum costellata]
MNKHPMRHSMLLLVGFLIFSCLSSLIFTTSHPVYIVDMFLFQMNSATLSMSWVLDSVSMSFSTVVLLVAFSVFCFSSSYMSEDKFLYRFTILLFLFVVSMLILVFSQSFLTLLMGWDGLGVTSFLLIIYYQNKNSLESGFLTLMVNRLGDVMIMVTMIAIVSVGYSIMYYSSLKAAVWWFGPMYVLAALTKSAQFPFSSWLPAAMAAPTPVSALVHSSTLVTAGIYMIIRVVMIPPMEVDTMLSVLMFVGSVTCMLGGGAAMVENDIKKLIALSTLSQLGVMVMALGLGAYELALYHLFSHAMFKALLFMAAGHIMMLSFGVQDLRLLSGLLKYSPSWALYFVLPSLCLMGAPFVTGYYSKHMLLEMSSTSSINLMSLSFLMISAVFSAGYMVRLLNILLKRESMIPHISTNLKLADHLPMILLLVFSLWYGHVYFHMNSEFLHISSTSDSFSLWLIVMLGLGCSIGLLLFKLPSPFEWALASMFFLMPLTKNLTFILPRAMKVVSFLDQGWLEPFNIVSPIKRVYKWTLGSFMWPYMKFSPLVSLVMSLILSLCLLFLP